MKYLYDGHTGTIYSSEKELDVKSLYCETCGDCDRLLGTFSTSEEFWKLLKDRCSIDGSGGYSLQYIFPIFVKEFDADCFVEYSSYVEKAQGFCSNSDENIIYQIEKIIKGN